MASTPFLRSRMASLAVGVLLLVAIECVLRVTAVNAGYRATHPSRFLREDPTVGHRLRASLRLTATPDAPLSVDRPLTMAPLPPFEVRTNALGLREDREVVPVAPPGTFRVLCLGDSVTFGYGVDRAATFPALLEDRLAGALPRQRVEVIDAGQPGHSSIQGGVFYVRVLAGFTADVVTLCYGHNDYGVGIVGSGSARARFEAATGTVRKIQWLAHRSDTYLLLLRGWEVVRSRLVPRPRLELPPPAMVRGRPDDLRDALVAMAGEARRRGARQVIVLTEPRLPGDENEPYYRAAALAAARASGATVADVAGAIERAMAAEPEPPGGWRRAPNPFFVDVTHLAPRGHAIAAQAIGDALRDVTGSPAALSGGTP